MNPIIAKCQELYAEGYSVSAVYLTLNSGVIRAAISVPSFFPLGEGGGTLADGREIKVDLDNLPQGISVSARERHSDVILELPGNAEQADALIQEVAAAGQAADVACFDGCRWLTKPNAWLRGSLLKARLASIAKEMGALGGRAAAGRPKPAKTPAAAAARTANLRPPPRKPRCSNCAGKPRRCAACVAASRAARP